MTKVVFLVTGNSSKLIEMQAIFPAGILLKSRQIDLPEIQSLDTRAIVSDKLERAFRIIKHPVIVEDVSAELDSLNGLPGPFIKFFEEKLGADALWQLANKQETTAIIRCTIGYYDGRTKHIVEGVVRGKVVAPKGKNGFGFDVVFVAKGQTLTNAQLSEQDKNKISHRALAIKQLVPLLS